MQKWEYLEISRGRQGDHQEVDSINGKFIDHKERKDFHSFLKELGEQGWELITVRDSRFFFKRPIDAK